MPLFEGEMGVTDPTLCYAGLPEPSCGAGLPEPGCGYPAIQSRCAAVTPSCECLPMGDAGYRSFSATESRLLSRCSQG